MAGLRSVLLLLLGQVAACASILRPRTTHPRFEAPGAHDRRKAPFSLDKVPAPPSDLFFFEPPTGQRPVLSKVPGFSKAMRSGEPSPSHSPAIRRRRLRPGAHAVQVLPTVYA